MTKKYRKKTILQVLPALVSGGVERGTVEIANKVDSLGNTSIVISAGGPLVQKLNESTVKHITMNVASKNPFTIWRNSKKIAKIIADHDVDIVHARSRAPAWSCYLATRSTKATLVTTFHGIYNFKGYFKKLYNSIMTKGEYVIAVSNFVKQHICNNYDVNNDKITVIHRGINNDEFSVENICQERLEQFRELYNVPKDTPVLLLPSRMTHWKGQHVLVDALEKIKHLNFYCIMAGDLSKHPSYVDRIKEKIKNYDIQEKIQLFGNQPCIQELYALSDIVLSTSIEPEAFGRTIIEAQSMEKLVISSDIGGACETIKNGKTGFHVKVNNVEDLSETIKKCIKIIGTSEAKKITTAARKSAGQNFSLESMLEKTISIYNQIK